MLTKEECREALDDIYALASPCKEEVYEHRSNYLKRRYDLISVLIEEHFSNPPLKFEELIKHKVVWDNELKEYAFVLEQYKPTILNVPAPSDLQAISLEYRGGEIECLLSEKVEETINDYYVPNRFYRKEVQE